MNVPLLTEDGTQTGEVTLLDQIFAAKVNVPLMHQVVTAQLAAARSGTHSTKTRGEVRGGGKKPWRQKGTGRARHGSIREPQWVGGGVAFGPKPRDHSVSVNKKMKVLALRSALTARAAEGKILILDDLVFEDPKTRRAIKVLEACKVEGKALVVIPADAVNAAYSFRNLPDVATIVETQLNTYDVLRADTVIFFRSALDGFQVRAAEMPGKRRYTPDEADTGEQDPGEAAAEDVGAPEATTEGNGEPPDEEVTA